MPLFADTFFYLALLNKRDANHVKALAFSEVTQDIIITTSWVLTEIGDKMSAPPARGKFITFIGEILKDKLTRVLPAEQRLFDLGFKLYLERPDKAWSLTDCISFAVMKF